MVMRTILSNVPELDLTAAFYVPRKQESEPGLAVEDGEIIPSSTRPTARVPRRR